MAVQARRAKMPQRAQGDEVAVYRLFGSAGELLYVGISKDPLSRWWEHLNSRPWWPRVEEFELAWYPSRAEARSVEREAIASEYPVHNARG